MDPAEKMIESYGVVGWIAETEHAISSIRTVYSYVYGLCKGVGVGMYGSLRF